MALFWLRTSYHAQRYMFQRYMLHSLLTQSFNIVNTPIILLFSKKWAPGFAAEDREYLLACWDECSRRAIVIPPAAAVSIDSFKFFLVCLW